MASLMLVNPKKRKTKRKTVRKAATKRRGTTTLKKVSRRRRSNPIKSNFANIAIDSAKNGAIGSLGAIAGTVATNFLPIPDSLKSGTMGVMTNALIGIGTGFAVHKFADKKIGIKMAEGAVTVALHGTFKNLVQKALPTVNLNGADDYEFDPALLGAYTGDGDSFETMNGAYSDSDDFETDDEF